MMLGRELSALGFEVFEAGDGQEPDHGRRRSLEDHPDPHRLRVVGQVDERPQAARIDEVHLADVDDERPVGFSERQVAKGLDEYVDR